MPSKGRWQRRSDPRKARIGCSSYLYCPIHQSVVVRMAQRLVCFSSYGNDDSCVSNGKLPGRSDCLQLVCRGRGVALRSLLGLRTGPEVPESEEPPQGRLNAADAVPTLLWYPLFRSLLVRKLDVGQTLLTKSSMQISYPQI